MSCAKSDFRGETGLPDRCFIPGFAGTPGPPSKGGFCVSGSSDFPSLQAGLSGSVKRWSGARRSPLGCGSPFVDFVLVHSSPPAL